MRASAFIIMIVSILLLPGILPAWPASGEVQPAPTASGSSLGDAIQYGEASYGFGYMGCGGASAPLVDGEYEQQVVEMVNNARAGQSPPVPPLKRVDALDAVARYHAADMAGDDYFAHNTYDRMDGSLANICAWFDRFASYYDGSYKGENIAGGFATPQKVMSAWLNSPSHRANILSPNYRELGLGYYEGMGTYTRYWVQDFGQRADVYPLIISGEAAATDSRTVQLYVYGDWEEMRLRNDDGQWSAWQPFQNTSFWDLEGGEGDHTVYVEVRSGTTVASSSDTIYLKPSGIGSSAWSAYLPAAMLAASP